MTQPALEQQKERIQRRLRGRPPSDQEQRELSAIDEALALRAGTVREAAHRICEPTIEPPEKQLEMSEREKVDAALEEARDKGYVDLEDFGDPQAERRCVIICSSHPPHPSDRSTLPAANAMAHYQLFVLLRALENRDSQSRLIVEGHPAGHIQRTTAISINFPDGRRIPLLSLEAQTYFLNHPDHFVLMQQEMRRDGVHGAFFDMSSYPHVEGAHRPDVYQTVQEIYDDRSEPRFLEKYRPSAGKHENAIPEMHQGRWWIFVNNTWVTPEELLRDAKECLRFEEMLVQLNSRREQEVFEYFQRSDPTNMPMAWVGLLHKQPITERCLAAGMAVRTVVPIADRNLNIISIPPIVRQLHDFAAVHVQANEELARRNTGPTPEPSPDRSEREKVDAALEEARDKGLVDIEDLGDPNAEKRCVIIGSAHPPDPSVRKIQRSTTQAQYELFCFLSLLNEQKATSTLLVEGSVRGKIARLDVTLYFDDGRKLSIQTPEAQRLLMQHPERFRDLQQCMQRDGMHPSFYLMSSYPSIEGAHDPALAPMLDRIYADLAFENTFMEKYRPLHGGSDTPTAKLRDERWAIFVNSCWLTPEEIVQDCAACLRFHDELDHCDVLREREVVEHFEVAEPSGMPLAWVGLEHLHPIAQECIRKGMAVRTVVPVAHRNLHTASTRPIAQQLHDFAAFYVQANQELAQSSSPQTTPEEPNT